MITVFTPTYNRAYILSKLYNSLKNQTSKDFEWLIIDDGSTDYTKDLVGTFMSEQQIMLRYYCQENGGKHRAINKGVRLAKGEWFFIVDSDDYLPNDSIETIKKYISQIAEDNSFAGVSGLRCYPNGKTIGGEFKYTILDTDAVTVREKYRVKGDMAEVWRTSVLKEYPFPEFENEKFMSEGTVWMQIAKRYRLRYFNKGVYICEYLTDGLTRNIRKCRRSSPQGSMYNLTMVMRDKRFSVITKIRAAVNYWRYSKGVTPCCKENIPPRWAYLFILPGTIIRHIDIYLENHK